MAIDTYLPTIESKKQTKQTRRTETESWIWRAFWWLPRWEGVWGMGEELRGLTSTTRWLQNSHGNVKYSIGSGVSKGLIWMTHGHEQWCGDCKGVGGVVWMGQRGKNGTTVITKSIKYN